MRKELFDAKQIKLDNGLKIVTIKRDTQLMSLNIGFNVGSIYEEDNLRGISHFVEHMVFKGTTSKDNQEINNFLEQIGGDYNAYTDYTETVYSITALGEELENSLDIMADMLINSNFPQKEIKNEKGVILSEIKASNDDIEDYCFKIMNSIAFDTNPIKHDVLGYEKTVNNIKRNDLLQHYKKYYVPNNCCISVVSPYEHEEIIEKIKKYFNSWKNNEIKRKHVIIESNKAIKKKTFKREIEQASILYLYTFHDLSKYEELVLRVLNHKFVSSSNSILFRELREKRGLAYDVYSSMDSTKNIKTFYIYTSVSAENINKTIDIINQCIDDIKNREVIFDNDIMKLIKKIFKTSLATTLEDSNELGNYALLQCMENEDIYEFLNEMDDINKMTGEDLYNVAIKVLNNPTIHILQPEESDVVE